jgi:hypothetical protein
LKTGTNHLLGLPGERMRHFKTGDEYLVIFPAVHTESGESLTVYVRNHRGARFAVWLIAGLLRWGELWARPTRMLNETVELPNNPNYKGAKVYAARFVKTGEPI